MLLKEKKNTLLNVHLSLSSLLCYPKNLVFRNYSVLVVGTLRTFEPSLQCLIDLQIRNTKEQARKKEMKMYHAKNFKIQQTEITYFSFF